MGYASKSVSKEMRPRAPREFVEFRGKDYREFIDSREMEAYLLDSYRDDYIKAGYGDRDLVASIYMGFGYDYWNAKLRGKEFDEPLQRAMDEEGNILKLDEEIHSSKLKDDLVLYRGIGKEDIQELEVGSTWHDPGFLSTTLAEGTAKKHIKKHTDGGYLMVIYAPKGTPAIAPVLATSPSKFRNVESEKVGQLLSEKELLLPRGSDLEVVGVDHDSKVITFQYKGETPEPRGYINTDRGTIIFRKDLNHPWYKGIPEKELIEKY